MFQHFYTYIFLFFPQMREFLSIIKIIKSRCVLLVALISTQLSSCHEIYLGKGISVKVPTAKVIKYNLI